MTAAIGGSTSANARMPERNQRNRWRVSTNQPRTSRYSAPFRSGTLASVTPRTVSATNSSAHAMARAAAPARAATSRRRHSPIPASAAPSRRAARAARNSAWATGKVYQEAWASLAIGKVASVRDSDRSAPSSRSAASCR